MSGVATTISLLYFLIVVGVGVYLLLMTRFLRAHPRGADAHEVIARKLSLAAREKLHPGR